MHLPDCPVHFFALIAAGAFAFACSGEDGELLDGGARDGGPPQSGMVTLSTTAINLGAVVVGTTDSAELLITNPFGGKVEIALSEISGANADRFARSVNIPQTNGTFLLEPGGVATVTVEASPTAEGDLVAMLVVDSCAGACPQTVALNARGAPSGVVCPMSVDLGVSNPGGCITRPVTCTNRGNATERITAVELDPVSDTEFTIVEPALPINLAPDAELVVEVSYCPDEVAGHAGELVVLTFEPFETEHRVALSGSGGGANVSCTPTALNFGMVGVGASVSGFVVCSNEGFEDAIVTGTIMGSDEFTAGADVTILVGERGVFSVTHEPTTAGAKQATLQIASNDPDSPTIDISLSSSAITIGPCNATIQPPSVDFGLSGVGQEREGRVIVQNTGTEACLFRAASILPGSDPAFGIRDLPAPGTAVAPSERIRLTATFAPGASGAVEGTLDISFSNPGTPALNVALAGTGGPQPLNIEPALVDFGDVAVGCAAPALQRVTLTHIASGMGSIVNASIVQTGTDFSLVASGIPAQLMFADTTTVDIGFTPSATGFKSASLRLVTGGSTNPLLIPLVGRGVTDVQRTDTVVLTPRKVDVLFVVDDSCSMADSQAALTAAVDVITDVLTQRGADAHLAVVTTDMDDEARMGRFLGAPAVLEGTTSGLAAELAIRFSPGIGGSGDEQGIAAAVAAVTSPLIDNENAGFLRPDADLAVFILSDENDFSPDNPTIDQHVRSLRQAAGSGRLFVSAIVGPPVGPDCNGPYGLGQVGERYAQLVGRTGRGGQLLSYCADMRENVAAATTNLFGGASVPLSTKPVITTIAVSSNGAQLAASAYAYEAAQNRIVFTDPSTIPSGATIVITYDAHCVSGTCGDGNVDAGEQCDDMNMSSLDTCIDCFDAVCGDGFVNAISEECDDGNLVENDECLTACTAARCGDGVLQLGVEECDDGNTTSGDGCPSMCRFYVETPLQTRAFVPLTAGSTLTFSGGFDDGIATLTMPFAFRFYDQPMTEVFVSVNGFASPSSFAGGDSYDNVAIPSPSLPNGLIAPWWTDLFLDEAIPEGADVSWELQGVAPNRVLVIEWRDLRAVDHNTANHRRFTFQAALFETTSAIEFRYAEAETRGRVPTVVAASAGIEDESGTAGFESLGCSPACDGRPRPPRADGFPENTVVTYTP